MAKTYTPKIDRTTLLFLKLIGDHCLPMPELEHRFHPERRWRVDFAWPDFKVAVEVEGAVWTRGRHTRPLGFFRDCEKYNHLALAGWFLLRFSPQQVITMSAINMIGQLIKQRLNSK